MRHALLMLLACALPGSALAQKPAAPAAVTGATVRAEAVTRTVDCNGTPAEVGGNRNTLTFRGACRGLTLRGDANTVAIELAPGARIDIEGNRNRLRYTVAGGGDPPSVRVSGSDTDLAPSPGAPPPAAAPLPVRLSGDNQNLDVDCGGRDVDIQGNHSHYTLTGGCHALVAHGDGNTLRAELQPGARVEIEGNGTVLTYRVRGAGGDAAVTVRGNDSRALREGQVALAAPPATPPAAQPIAVPPPATPPTDGAAIAPPPPPAPESPPPATVAPAVSAAAPMPSVPMLMRDLGASVVEAGTQVTFKADQLFDGTTDNLHADAPGRLGALDDLIRRTHPSGVRISADDPADPELAHRRADAVGGWLKAHAAAAPITTASATGPAAQLTVLLAR
jgi:hypothetical protein